MTAGPGPSQRLGVQPLLTCLLGQGPHYFLRQPHPAGSLLPCLYSRPCLCHSSLGEGSSLAEGLTYSQEGAGLDPVKASEDKTWWAGTNPCSG